jgi:hypothetical protein
MKKMNLTLGELALIAGTRAAGGLGIGFLVADRVPGPARRAIGWTLLLVGLLSTVPLVVNLVVSDNVAHDLD